MTVRAYPAYRQSGFEWLGQVPHEWALVPLKRALRLITDRANEQTFPVALENLEGWTGRFLSTETTYDGEGIAFRKGDLLFGKLRPYLAKVWASDRGGEAVGDIHVLRPIGANVPAFLQRFLLTREAISLIDGATQGAKMPRASWEFMGSLVIALPTPDEQFAIAAFLDRETGKIDALVAEQERLIALLKEKRQAVISHAVTKGLNPNAPMKDSGVPWLGEIPASWIVCRIGYHATVQNGSTPDRDNTLYWSGDCLIPWITSGEVNQYVISEPSEFITSLALEHSNLRIVPKGAVLVGLVGQGRTRGMAARMNIEGTINQNVAAIIPGAKIGSEFLHYVLESAYEHLREYGRGGNQAALNCEIIRAFAMPVPPLPEQQQIVELVSRATSELEVLTGEATRAITLLRERRAALISAAVTGKIDVRDTVAQPSSQAA